MSPLLLHSNTNQYNINGLICTYTEMFRMKTCCNHILKAAGGFRGQEATFADPGIFVSFILSSAYFTVYRGGPMVLLLGKLYFYFTKDPEGVHYFPGGVKLCPGGEVQMLISLETHIRTCYFPGGVRTPYAPLDPHMGNVIITGRYLSQPRF